MPNEILEIIFSYLDLASQLNFRMVCHHFNQFEINNFWDTGGLIESTRITEKLLKKYPKIKYLNLYDNLLVSDINFLEHVVALKISGRSIISDAGIIGLRNLVYLDISHNCRIKDLSTKPKIKYLVAVGSCGISDDSIKHLDLVEIDCTFNKKITDISIFPNLRVICTNSIIYNDMAPPYLKYSPNVRVLPSTHLIKADVVSLAQ